MRCVTLANALTLGLAGCWSSPSVDGRVQPIIEFVKSKCGFIVDAAAVGAMLAAPNPATPPLVKSIGTAICVALNEDRVEVNTLFGWGEGPSPAAPAACPMVNGVCITGEKLDGQGD